METEWIIVADSSRARIFEKSSKEELPVEIQDFVNPAGRLDEVSINTDSHGRFFSQGEREQGHTAQPNTTPKEHEAEVFAKTVTNFLNEGRNHHRYAQLHIIAQPKFLGLIRNKLNKEVQKLVVGEVAKDLSTANAQTIEQYVYKRA